MVKQRDTTIDLMKALGITLMVWGHAGLPIKFAIFNMPLFFICSGYCFKDSYLTSFRGFLKKRIKGLYIPFIKWNCFCIIVHNLLYEFHIYPSEYSLREIGYKVIASVIAMEQRESLVGGFWFLKTLFVASILSFFFIKWFKDRNTRLCRIELALIVCLISAMALTHFNIMIPKLFIGGRELIATTFILSGYLMKNKDLNRISTTSFLFLSLGVVGLISYIIPGGILVVDSYWIPLFFIGSLSGVLLCYIIAHLVSQYFKKVEQMLLYIGKHTIEILTWHLLSFKIVSLLLIVILGLEIEQLSSFPTIHYDLHGYKFIPQIAYFFVGLSIPTLICYLYEKYNKVVISRIKLGLRSILF